MRDVNGVIPDQGWVMANQQRFDTHHIKQGEWANRGLVALVGKIGKLNATNLWVLLLKHPKLMRGFLLFSSQLMPFGTLDRQDTELCILRVAWNCRCRYEWGQHVDIAMRAGLTVEEIRHVTQGVDAHGWKSHQKALIHACDDIHHDRMVSDQHWQSLKCFFDEKRLVEILMLIGFYEGLAGFLNSSGIALDPKVEQVLNTVKM